MDVAVLLPEEILRSCYSGNKHVISPPPSSSKPVQRPRSDGSPPPAPAPAPSADGDGRTEAPVTGGRVRILTRREELTHRVVDGSPRARGSSDRVLMVGRKGIPDLDGFYAGSGFAASPPPSSLPMPAVIGKKKVRDDEKARSELRRILQLDD